MWLFSVFCELTWLSRLWLFLVLCELTWLPRLGLFSVFYELTWFSRLWLFLVFCELTWFPCLWLFSVFCELTWSPICGYFQFLSIDLIPPFVTIFSFYTPVSRRAILCDWVWRAGGCPHRFLHNNCSSVYQIFTKLDHMIPLWKGKNPIYFGVIRSKVKVTITINIIFNNRIVSAW